MILYGLQDEFDFQFVDNPDILIINCYGQQPLPKGNYLKVGYYTENLPPDLENFDWFFGCQYNDAINHPRYCKRVYGGIHPQLENWSFDRSSLREKDRFCLFLYSARVPHREAFFKQLCRRKYVHAPGKSMHNIDEPELAARGDGDWHASKLKYMQRYRFTLAFENSIADGYFTEKLTDAFLSHTIPVYFGDPSISRVYNKHAFIDASEYLPPLKQPWQLPEKKVPYAPFSRAPGLLNKLCGRANDTLKELGAYRWSTQNYVKLCDRILEIDATPKLRDEMMSHAPVAKEFFEIRDRHIDTWRAILRQ